MNNIKKNLEKYLLIRHTKAELNEYNKRINKTIPWIWRKGLMNNIQTHCSIILNSIFDNNKKYKYNDSKFLIDSILKYNVERSESILKSNKRIKNMKTFLQLNSFIIYDEIEKGLAMHKKKKNIDFNIKMQLMIAQEKLNSSLSVEDVLNDTIENKSL